jgi:PAS domain S-box-containing protein
MAAGKFAALIRMPSALASVYLVFGLAWLWATGDLVSRVALDAADVTALEKFKGFLFVVTTAAMLYAWLRCMRQLQDKLPHVEGRLRDSETQLSRILEFSPDAVLVHDARRILYANPAFFKLLDIPPGRKLSSIKLRDVVAPEYLSTMSQRVWRLASEVGVAAPVIVNFKTPGGKLVEAEHTSCSMLVNGCILVQSHMRDLTERNHAWRELQRWNDELDAKVRERTAELAAANKALEFFTYSVAHDLRSPVGRIHGFATALVEASERQDLTNIKHFARRVAVNAKTMGEMIDGMLLLSRADRAQLNLALIDADTQVREFLAELGESSTQVVIHGKLPNCVGDPVLVREVWANLISNALKYNQGAAVPRVMLSGEKIEAECQFCVSDNGIGFEEAEASTLFRTFHRLGNAREFAGTGVGLSIVKRIVMRHGGRVWAHGIPNEGATFYFTLPAPDGAGASASVYAGVGRA